ncbi:phosphate/phosphite/phosphonate ABC transporter substrate-binding protein [Herbaspirillum huttiense F1]|jgi:phosphate/phosphite/phosphonate ABC transporters, periplasmic binding protein|uniref:Phosphonate ABC transporter substrate-binding protein n=2 Tax=Herbaspirillum TaxID=963 RepID=A0A225STK8_9BURK|nr:MULTISPECIES: phosphate/phosphite/phosphonate ABC transporter substrate-binding protein [Herbaspirillum]MBW9336413.1 phosphate/phosphite/phosphonate ABC transporter substrate-binding protein [Herbaspirillum sp. RU 5E]MBP1317072.1 phosphonate transport system substrate-binding protein [Herbaspirillum sp. 1130]MCO4859896.1 phosphate/phosphite/phosphonate ABC transporter substrate-binding protein [Herbaspirillum sp. WGmk3]MDR9849394.1 phosphate/phosphite/phosphonate ABC transporter substrate-bi
MTPRLIKTLLALALAAPAIAFAQDTCSNRGDLDQQYCDANHDLTADTPTDPKKLKNPNTLVFTFTPVEDPAVYDKIFKPFTDYLSQCTAKKVVFFQVQSNAAEIEAMRSGRLHVGGFSPGPTNFAVNIAGAVPFAVIGDAKGYQGYTLNVIVRKDSPIQKMTDLKGKKVAHTAPSSNSGHMAPMALFPKLGVTPDKDYKVIFSGKHDQSILGVNSGDYDAAAVASDVFDRMVERGVIKAENFRVIWHSEKFPTQDFAYAHDLEPNFRDKMLKCFYDYRFTDELKKAFAGSDRFYPINYKKDFEMVRFVAQSAGESFNRAAYDKQNAGKK